MKNLGALSWDIFHCFGGSEWFNDPLLPKGCWQTGIGNLRRKMVPHPSFGLLLRNTPAQNKTYTVAHCSGILCRLISMPCPCEKKAWNNKKNCQEATHSCATSTSFSQPNLWASVSEPTGTVNYIISKDKCGHTLSEVQGQSSFSCCK